MSKLTVLVNLAVILNHFTPTSAASTTNDWSKPCFNGICSYELPPTGNDGGVSGVLTITGSPNAITDITPAAGWLVLGCTPDALAQDIRIVCADESICGHLYLGNRDNAPQGKVVRLPEHCGKNAFGRIAREWTHEDQRIPGDVAARLPMRKGGKGHVVKAISVDTDFARDTGSLGTVSFSIQGSSLPNVRPNVHAHARQIMDEYARNGKGGGKPSRNITTSEYIGNTAAQFAKLSKKFDKSLTTSIPLVDISKSHTLIDQHITCPAVPPLPAFAASLSAVATANVHAAMQLGVAVSGTIIPPKVHEFSLFTGLSADLEASLKVAGSASGIGDSGRIPIFTVGLPGLHFHGILEVGPSFGVDVQAKAELDVNAEATFALSYKTESTQLFFPASATHPSTGSFIPKDGHFKISVPASVGVKGKVEGHVIPNVNFGIDAFGGL